MVHPLPNLDRKREPRNARPAIRVILNPTAGAGRAGRGWPTLRSQIESVCGRRPDVAVTTAPGEAETLARDAARRGITEVMVIGGDGTIHEVVNGLLAVAGQTCVLGVIDIGTGSGFAESLGLPKAWADMVRIAVRGHPRSIDIGRVRFRRSDGQESTRHFVNECQIGIGAAVCAALGRPGKWLGGRLGFGLTALGVGLLQRARPMEVRSDGAPSTVERRLGVSIANGPLTGGGMSFAPDARLDDARLDLVAIGDIPRCSRPAFLARLYEGRPLGGRYATHRQATTIAVHAQPAASVAADGEVLGCTPASVHVEPGALLVRGPEGRAS